MACTGTAYAAVQPDGATIVDCSSATRFNHGGQVLMRSPSGKLYYAFAQLGETPDIGAKAALKAVQDLGVGQAAVDLPAYVEGSDKSGAHVVAGSNQTIYQKLGIGNSSMGDYSYADETGGSDYSYADETGGMNTDASGAPIDVADNSFQNYQDADGNTYDEYGNLISSGPGAPTSTPSAGTPSGQGFSLPRGGGGSMAIPSGNPFGAPKTTTSGTGGGSPIFNFNIGPGPQTPARSDLVGAPVYNYTGARGITQSPMRGFAPGTGGLPNATTSGKINSLAANPMFIVAGIAALIFLARK